MAESGGDSADAEIAFLSASTMAARIRAGTLTAERAVGAVLAQIARSQAPLNAYVTVCADEALAAARQADAARARGEALGPLHGVPFSVKDILNTKAVRTSWGSRLMAQNVPDGDAVAVARLKAAGAILVGKTATSEFAWKLLTDSQLTGITRNPWNTALTSGGSSGGAAAAVAAGLGPIAVATDAGASTRLPAACCGVVGLKPTLGLVPHSQVPDGFANFIHIGILARGIADIAVTLDSVAGAHPSDPFSLAAPPVAAAAALAAPIDLRGKRIAWRPLIGNTALDAEVRARCEEALHALATRGAAVETIDEKIENPEPTWRVLQQANWAARFGARIDEVAPKIDPGFAEGIRAGLAYSGRDIVVAGQRRTQFFRQVQEWLQRVDWIATPTMSRPPVPVYHPVDRPIEIDGTPVGDMRAAWIPYLNLFNLTGHPAISIPAGFTRDGMPVGLQLVGRWLADSDLLRLCAVLEADRPWAQARPGERAEGATR